MKSNAIEDELSKSDLLNIMPPQDCAVLRSMAGMAAEDSSRKFTSTLIEISRESFGRQQGDKKAFLIATIVARLVKIGILRCVAVGGNLVGERLTSPPNPAKWCLTEYPPTTLEFAEFQDFQRIASRLRENTNNE